MSGDAQYEESAAAVGANLRSDLDEIRQRVLGTTERSSNADAEREIYEELKGRHQVDLNEEDNVRQLEDPTLIAHMEAARRRLAEQQKAMQQIPRLEVLRTSYIAAMGKASASIRMADELDSPEKEQLELAHRLAIIIDHLMEGQSPHGFLESASCRQLFKDPALRATLTKLKAKAAEIADSIERTNEARSQVRANLFVMRRDFEATGDGLIELVESSQEERRLMREYVSLASRSEAARATSAPADTVGERLIEGMSGPSV